MPAKTYTADQVAARNEAKGGESRGTSFAKWIPKQSEGVLTVRFLTEHKQNGWVAFEQLYDPSLHASVVITEENEEYYDRKRKDADFKQFLTALRWYAPAVVVDNGGNDKFENGELAIIEIPNGRGGSYVAEIDEIGDRSGQNDDITTVDIELYKVGTGTDTVYKAYAARSQSNTDPSQFEAPDLFASLEAKISYQNKQAKDKGIDLNNGYIEDAGVRPERNDDEPPFVPGTVDTSAVSNRRAGRPARRN